MGLFSFKKKVVREISNGVWGHLVNEHGFDVDTRTRSIRCVEKEGFLDETKPLTFLRSCAFLICGRPRRKEWKSQVGTPLIITPT